MPFSQTLRSLDADQVRFSIIGLIVLLLLLVAWLVWFLVAPINLYETSRPIRLPLDEAVVVDFPAGSLERIRPGQPAILHLETPDQQPATKLPAEVMDITVGNDSQTQVWLLPDFDDPFFTNAEAQEGLVNRVDIEIDRISPLTLLKQSYPAQ